MNLGGESEDSQVFADSTGGAIWGSSVFANFTGLSLRVTPEFRVSGNFSRMAAHRHAHALEREGFAFRTATFAISVEKAQGATGPSYEE